MELVLLILKIILTVFLVVSGIVVLMLGIILIVPIRYEVSGSIADSGAIQIKGKVSYLLSIVKMLFSYEERQFDTKFFVFGFEKKIQSEDIDETPDEAEDETADETAKETENQTIDETAKETENQTIDAAAKEAEKQTIDETVKETEKQTIEETAKEAEKDTVDETVDETADKTVDVSRDRTTFSHGNREKKDEKKNNVSFTAIKQQLTDEHNKSAVRKVWSDIRYLLRHSKLRKVITDFVFSTGDPAATGQVLGVLCMIPTLYQYDFKITPDFEADEAYIKGTFLAAGKVRLIHVLIIIWRLISDKEVRLVGKKILTFLER